MGLLFKVCNAYFFIFLASSSTLRSRAAVDSGPTNLVLPLNLTNWIPVINDTTTVNDTILPDTYLLDDDIVWPESSTPSSSPPLNTSVATPLIRVPRYNCNAKAYGKNLNVASCLDAYNKMKADTEPVVFGERGEGEWDANLPFRILSTDGFCAIDFSHRAGAMSDKIIPKELKENARVLLQICVSGTPNQGGVVSNLGENGNLALRVTPYKPNVHCDPPGSNPPWSDCRRIIDSMPTDGTRRIFGQKDDPDPEISVKLPAGWNTEKRRCQVFIDTLLPEVGKDTYDWYKLWAAANAVDYMCLQYGRSGLAIGLGERSSFCWSFRVTRMGMEEQQGRYSSIKEKALIIVLS